MSYNTKNPTNTLPEAPIGSNNTAVRNNDDAEKGQVPKSLRQSVEQSLKQYFNELDGQQTTALYDLFMHQVEAPLFECVMQHTQDNQSKAAALLGLNRGTLRKKLKQYDLL
jgi:Fis family transcriptional regulator